MYRNKWGIGLFLLLCTVCTLLAQDVNGWSLHTNLQYGKIIRHSPRITYPIPPVSTGLLIDLRYQTFGRKEWHEWQRFPEVGATLMLYNPGNPDILGYGLGLLTHLNLPLVKRSAWKLGFQLGTGLGYLTRSYDPITNPLNNAIGSGLNNITLFRLEGSWYPDRHWAIHLGGSFMHFSNAAASSPNLGINIPAISLGTGYRFQPPGPADYRIHGRSRKTDDRWGGVVNFQLGYRENSISGGPKLPVYLATAAVRFSLNRVNDLQLGLGYEYQRSVYEFALNSYQVQSIEEARQGATRWMILLADEFRFGSVGIYLMAGFYISPNSISVPAPVANNLGLRYYFALPFAHTEKRHCFAGVMLKAHRGVAEYASLGLGFRW